MTSTNLDQKQEQSSASQRPDDRHLRLWSTAALLFVSCTAIVVALLHNVDTDEGSILLVGKLMAHGGRLYTDFNYPYPPVSAYAYSLWMRLFGFNWISGRALAALLTIGVALLLYTAIRRSIGRRFAIMGVLLYGFSAQTLAYFTNVKTLALATLFILSAYVLTSHVSWRPRLRFGLVGILIALAVSTRPYLIVVAPLFIVWVFRSTPKAERRSALSSLIIGGLLGALVNLPFFLHNPAVFMHNVIGAQTSRYGGGAIGGLRSKLDALSELFSLSKAHPHDFGAPGAAQFWMLLLMNVGWVVRARRQHRRQSLATWIIVVVGLVSFLPNPVYAQYFSIIIPFLVFNVAMLMNSFIDEADATKIRRVSMAAVVFVVAFLSFGHRDISRFLDTRFGGQHPASADLGSVRAVSRKIVALSKPGDQVLSFWPGYLLETDDRPVPRTENQTAWSPWITYHTPASDQERFRLASPTYIESLIRSRVPRLIIVERDFYWIYDYLPTTYFDQAIHEAGYSLASTVGTAEIYRCCQSNR